MHDHVLVERTAWATRIWQLEYFSVALVVAIYALSGGADSSFVNVLWLLAALALAVLGVRASRVEVAAAEDGIVIRNIWRTRRVAWTRAGVRQRRSLPKALGAWSLIIMDRERSIEASEGAGLNREEMEAAVERIKAAINARSVPTR